MPSACLEITRPRPPKWDWVLSLQVTGPKSLRGSKISILPLASVSKRVLVEMKFYSRVKFGSLYVNKTNFQIKGFALDSLWNETKGNLDMRYSCTFSLPLQMVPKVHSMMLIFIQSTVWHPLWGCQAEDALHQLYEITKFIKLSHNSNYKFVSQSTTLWKKYKPHCKQNTPHRLFQLWHSVVLYILVQYV